MDEMVKISNDMDDLMAIFKKQYPHFHNIYKKLESTIKSKVDALDFTIIADHLVIQFLPKTAHYTRWEYFIFPCINSNYIADFLIYVHHVNKEYQNA